MSQNKAHFLFMAIKEELKEEVKEEGGGEDELDALDALEKEAKEYNKVCLCMQSHKF